MFGHGPGGFHHPGVFGWLFFAVIVALLIVGIVLLVRLWSSPRGHGSWSHTAAMPPPGVDPAVTELRIRYARGDMTWAEYVQRSANLGYPAYPGTGPIAPAPEAQPPPPSS